MSAATESATLRRAVRGAKGSVRFQWFINEVNSTIQLTMRQRVVLATELVRSRVVRNISIPVTRGSGGQVIQRSKPGEFPRADTTTLKKDIFGITLSRGGVSDGFVGTTLDYGLILEISKRFDRSFLLRTFKEELPVIRKILTGPIKGAGGQSSQFLSS